MITFVTIYRFTSISIHALREESDQPSVPSLPTVIAISIHALREESDTPFSLIYYNAQISIHALREESDYSRKYTPKLFYLDFNPRSPRGERPLCRIYSRHQREFQSTLSARRATR